MRAKQNKEFNFFGTQFTAASQQVYDNVAQYEREAKQIVRNDPYNGKDCPCTRGEDGCMIHGA